MYKYIITLCAIALLILSSAILFAKLAVPSWIAILELVLAAPVLYDLIERWMNHHDPV